MAASVGEEKRRVVLAGAGHAHLYTLRRMRALTERGLEVVVIAPENFWYSGMATGVLGGEYAPEDDQIDVERLVREGGGEFIRDRVVAIETSRRCLHLQSGKEVRYDVLSLNVGSESRPLAGENEHVYAIKPLFHLWRLRQRLEADVTAGMRPRVVIAGGGASGSEIAANVRALTRGASEVTVVAREEQPAASLGASAAKAMGRALRERGIEVRTGAEVVRIEGRTAVIADGRQIAFDYLVNATGLRAPAMLRESGLRVNERGELVVDSHLRSIGDERIFGGGDCVQLTGQELARIGVYAVRQGPVLYRNLAATLTGGLLRTFRPQRYFLLILNLGDGRGLACWRGFYWKGRATHWLKNAIDRRFIGGGAVRGARDQD